MKLERNRVVSNYWYFHADCTDKEEVAPVIIKEDDMLLCANCREAVEDPFWRATILLSDVKLKLFR